MAQSIRRHKDDDARRLKELEKENGQLRRLVADEELKNHALKEIARGRMKVKPPATCHQTPVVVLGPLGPFAIERPLLVAVLPFAASAAAPSRSAGQHPLRQRSRADRAVPREWCRRAKADTAYIEPGSLWQNVYVESFDSRLRDELPNTEVLTYLEEAQIFAADWRADHNANHPRLALGMNVSRQHERIDQPRTLARGGPRNGGLPSAPRTADDSGASGVRLRRDQRDDSADTE